MCVLSLALTALSLFLLVLNLSHPDVPIYLYWAVNTLIAIGNSTVGAVIVPRLSPKNPIGWLFCATGLSFGVLHFSGEYVVYTLLAAPGSLPASEALAWILAWLWVPVVGLQVLLLLLFPDGRLPSPRWRWYFWLSLLLILIGAVSVAFSPGEINVGLGPIYNPLGVEGLPNSYEPVQALVLTLSFVSAVSLFFVRLRRARGVERQQIKWFAYTAMVASSGAILTYTVSEVIGSLWLEWAGYVLLLVGLIGIPISMGIAILRYRLYEIDLIINRTLVYGLLTAILVLFYFGSVTALQYLFSLLTGQGNTLAIARAL